MTCYWIMLYLPIKLTCRSCIFLCVLFKVCRHCGWHEVGLLCCRFCCCLWSWLGLWPVWSWTFRVCPSGLWCFWGDYSCLNVGSCGRGVAVIVDLKTQKNIRVRIDEWWGPWFTYLPHLPSTHDLPHLLLDPPYTLHYFMMDFVLYVVVFCPGFILEGKQKLQYSYFLH